jgi:predicted DNA repair protein MutK
MRYLPIELQPIMLWLRATLDRVKKDEGGYSPVTWVYITAISLVMAIVVGTIIYTAVVNKAHTINLNNGAGSGGQ